MRSDRKNQLTMEVKHPLRTTEKTLVLVKTLKE